MDQYNLQRFVDAQAEMYEQALKEIRSGRKYGHWIWYVFPQLASLGHSYNSKFYGIGGMAEAKAYLAHPQLRANLLEISEALLELECSNAHAIMSHVDTLKLRSSMTLFAQAEPECEVFQKVLDKFFDGRKDSYTVVELLRE